jgi:hypothetical protein
MPVPERTCTVEGNDSAYTSLATVDYEIHVTRLIAAREVTASEGTVAAAAEEEAV